MRFPLPGNSGLDPTVHLSPANFTQKVAKNQSSVLNTVLTRPTMFERHTEVINQFNSAAADLVSGGAAIYGDTLGGNHSYQAY